jgi:acyl carrier protein
MTEEEASRRVQHEPASEAASPDAARIRAILVETLGTFLGAGDNAIDPRRPLAEYGIDSVDLLTLVLEIEERLARKFPPSIFFDVDTLDQLTDRIVLLSPSVGSGTAARPLTSP